MKAITQFFSKEKSLAWIILLGAVIRLLFIFVGGRIYYGRPDFFLANDSYAWFHAFINLLDYGTFTIIPGIETAKFFRPPGYSFLFGIFYLLTFKNYVLAWEILVATQIVMDVASVYLIAAIAKSVMKEKSEMERNFFSNLSALLYAIYPMAIVFVPLLQAETSSIFFLLLSLHFAFRKFTGKNAFLSGIFIGIATLIRLQCAFIIPFLAYVFFAGAQNAMKVRIRQAVMFCFAVGITYGLWPARNYFLQGRLLFSQDLRVGGHWSDDFLAFVDFTHSIDTDHSPYYWPILKNEKVNWPKAAYLDPGDSLLLDSAVTLCRTCSPGFALWRYSEFLAETSELLVPPPCDTAITKIFTSLTQKQKSRNTFHFWVTVSLQNLKKCLFKISLMGNKSFMVKAISSFLFIYRSLLIVLGLIGIYIAYRRYLISRSFLFVALGYMIVWYLYISIFYRNIEMRYLLPADIILLIPAAITIMQVIFNKYLKQYE